VSAWNVKNEMPTGSITATSGVVTGRPTTASTRLTFSAKKLKYLKKQSTPMLEPTLSARYHFRRTGSAFIRRAAQ
jgi:hypothetical protein